MSKLIELMICDRRKIFNLAVFIFEAFKLLPEPYGPLGYKSKMALFGRQYTRTVLHCFTCIFISHCQCINAP